MSPRRVEAVSGSVVLAGATVGAFRGIEPFTTWYYPFAWSSTLLLADTVLTLREDRSYLFGRPGFLATLLFWSVPFWLLFELVNLRLANWYYVFVPDGALARRTGIVMSFATVLPAILTSERLLDSFGLARGLRIPPLRVTPGLLATLPLVGGLMIGLALGWPGLFFPLVWGGFTLIADPWVYSRDPDRSLVGDLERGRPGRIARLLLGGLAIGVLWEAFNAPARAGWIYTVPGFEQMKLFEMPLAGFLGFPVFALEGFAAWQTLVVAGLAVPRRGPVRSALTGARVANGLAALAFSAVALLAMERDTVSSVTPRLADLPGIPAARLGEYDPFSLARSDPARIATFAEVDTVRAREWIETARLATLRGIGATNAARLRAVGVLSVAELAAIDADTLVARLSGSPDGPPNHRRVRVWVRAARRAIDVSS